MKYDVFIKNVRKHLELYKEKVLGITQNGTYRGQPYGHILPNEYKALNLGLPPSAYQVNGSVLKLIGCPELKLHMDWGHMNSSQILCISYFYGFINDRKKLKKLVSDVLKINAEAKNAEFEYITADGSNIDFVIHLKNGGSVFFEIKYTERGFGSATSKTADYKEIQKNFHSAINISDADYLKNYQLVRNVCLSPKSGSNYTVFLLPRANDCINEQYNTGISAIGNIEDFNVQLIYWEDLLTQIPDNAVFEKYFDIQR